MKDLTRGEIAGLARVLGVDFNVVTTALYEHGRDGLENLIDHHFKRLAEVDEKRLGDIWAARLGLGVDAPSNAPQGQAYAEGRQSLEDAWLGHCGVEEIELSSRGPLERRRTARMRATSSSETNGLPFESLFDARNVLFGPIPVVFVAGRPGEP